MTGACRRYRRPIPVTTRSACRPPQREQTRRPRQSSTGILAAYRVAISAGSGSTRWPHALHVMRSREPSSVCNGWIADLRLDISGWRGCADCERWASAFKAIDGNPLSRLLRRTPVAIQASPRKELLSALLLTDRLRAWSEIPVCLRRKVLIYGGNHG
jgi:hypothetical protein